MIITTGYQLSLHNVKLSEVFLKFTERKEQQRLRIKLPLLGYQPFQFDQ